MIGLGITLNSTMVIRIRVCIDIKFIPDYDQWQDIDEPAILPPIMKRFLGKPSRNRKRDEDEKRIEKRSNKIKCSKCHQLGHNTKTCKGGLARKEQMQQESPSQVTKKKAL